MIKKTSDEFLAYVKKHDLYFNGNTHAAFLLVIRNNLQEVFLVKHKDTGLWMIPGGRVDMKGTGRRIFSLSDEPPLQCAICEFNEETQHIIPQEMIANKISKRTFDGLRNITGKVIKKYFVDGSWVKVIWKYIVYFSVLDENEQLLFDSKEFDERGIETSQCAWVPIKSIISGEIQMGKKIKKTIENIMGLIK